MQAQEKNNSSGSGTVSMLLSIHSSAVQIPKKDKMKVVNFKMKESEIEAFDLYCKANGIDNKSELIRSFICRLIKE